MALHPLAVEYYQMLDDALGEMLDALHPDDLLIIVSDHGFRGVRRKFYIHEYLYRRGFLRMKSDRNRRRAEMLGFARNVVRTLKLQQVARLLRRQMRVAGMMVIEKEQHGAQLPDLDWERTRAWIPSASGFLAGYADIFLDEALSEEQIGDLVSALREIRDPETGLPLVVETYREEVYGTGPYAPAERHLIVLSNEQTTLPTELGRRELWETSDVTSGVHHPDGVLYLYGDRVKPGAKLSGAQVCDVAPTILAYMGMPLDEELDGRPVQDAFQPPSVPQEAVQSEGIVKWKLKQLASRT